MTASLVIYLLKWSLCLTLFYSLFRLCLRSETLHRLNRAVLLTILVGSMVLPLCALRTERPTLTSAGMQHAEAVIKAQFPVEPGGQIRSAATTATVPLRVEPQATAPFSWLRVALYIYIIGVAVAFGIYLYSLLGLLLTLRGGRRVRRSDVPAGVHLICSEQVQTPCSWMHWILIHPRDLQPSILLHELSHIRHGHSWDMLLCEFTARTLWFLPFAWMLRQDLADVHEYEADSDVLRAGINEDEYQRLLITKAAHARLRPVVNALTQSGVKKRFTMMCRRPSHRASGIKALYLLPCAGVVLTAFAHPAWMEKVALAKSISAPKKVEPTQEVEPPEKVKTAAPIEETFSAQALPAPKPTTEETEPAESTEQPPTEDTEQPQEEAIETSATALSGTWLNATFDKDGRYSHGHQKVILPNGTFYTMCVHSDGKAHTISAGIWQPIDDHHIVEHIEYITTDQSSEGKDNIISYSLADNDQQLYLSYVMPGNGVSGSEFWQRIE